MKKRLISWLLTVSTLLSLATPAFALKEPATPTKGAAVFIDDVRIDEGGNATVKILSKFAADKGRTGGVYITLPTDSTGISATNPVTEGDCDGADRMQLSDALQKTGNGKIGFSRGTKQNITISFNVPNVTATSKITATPSDDWSSRRNGANLSDVFGSEDVQITAGSIIVQYPVTVEIADNSETNAGFAIKTKTTTYNDKDTYDKDSTTPDTVLTTGGMFYVDSGEGQQNTPVLNFTVPENYYAEVTVNGGAKQTVGTSSFALPEAVTKDTTVSVKLVAGKVPADEYTNTTVTNQYNGYDMVGVVSPVKIDKKETAYQLKPTDYSAQGYTVYAYKLDNGQEQTIDASGSVTIDGSTGDHNVTFLYKRTDNSTVVPGGNGKILDNDDVTVKPAEGDAIVPDAVDKSVTLPADGKGGTVTDSKGNSVEVPAGTKVTVDGKIHLPDVQQPITPENPNPDESKFYVVTYKNVNTTLFTQLGKVGESVQVMDYPASADKPERKQFVGWNTMNSGLGVPYAKDSTINKAETLYAQWKDAPVDPSKENNAKITYHYDATDTVEAVEEVRHDEADTTFPGNLNSTVFTAPEGWELKGWVRTDNTPNQFYEPAAKVTLNKDNAWQLYARWYKVEDGSITVPGADTTPNTDKDAVAKGENLSPDVENGIITIPAGGSVTVNGQEYAMPNGGSLKYNGEITIKQGENKDNVVVKPGVDKPEVVDPNNPDQSKPNKTAFKVTYNSGEANQGTKVVMAVDSAAILDGAALFRYDGYKFGYWTDDKNNDPKTNIVPANTTVSADTSLTAHWYKVSEGGGVIVTPPGGGDIIVKPEKPGETPKPGENGKIDIKPGGEIEVKPGGTITLPDGGKLNPDGTITDKDGETFDPAKPNTWPDRYFMVAYDSNGGEGEISKQLGKDSITVKNADGFSKKNKENKEYTFNIWNEEADGSGTVHKVGSTIKYPGEKGKTITLYAMWYLHNGDGSITVPGKPDITIKPGPDGVVPGPDENGEIKVPEGGTVKKEPDGIDITPPGGTVVKPGGGVEAPDPDKPEGGGGSVTIDPSKPNGGNENFITIKFAPGINGTGKMADHLVNKNQDFTLPACQFTANGNFTFAGWNTQQDGKGDPYTDKITSAQLKAVTGNTLTLVAQWKSSDPTVNAKSATITFHWNDGTNTTSTQTVKWQDGASINAALTPDTVPTREGYTLTAWNSVADGSGVGTALGAAIKVENDKTYEYFAMWVKEGQDGSITVPGGDKGDVIVKPGPDGKPPVVNPDGSITVPPGGTVKLPPDGTEIVLPDGGTVKPDGTVEIPGKNPDKDNTIVVKPGGSIEVTKPDGSTDPAAKIITITYEAGNGTEDKVEFRAIQNSNVSAISNPFTWAKHVFAKWMDKNDNTKTYVPAGLIPSSADLTLVAQWYELDDNDNVIVKPNPNPNPGDKDNEIIVKPNPNKPDEKPKPGEDGKIEVKPGGEVEVKPGGGTVVLPDGGKVDPDTGNITDKDNNPIDPNKPETLPEGWYQVVYHSNAGNDDTLKITSKNQTAKPANTFDEPNGKLFVVWNTRANGSGSDYAPGEVVPAANKKVVDMYAIWKDKAVAPTTAIAFFDFAGGKDASGNTSASSTGDATASIIDVPNGSDLTREGYTFSGWKNGNQTVTEFKYGEAGSITTFTAQWTPKEYTVTFAAGTNGNMTGYTDPVKVNYNSSVAADKIPEITANAGFVFIGWSNGTGIYSKDAVKTYKVTGDVTFTAQYAESTKATVIFDYAGGVDEGGKTSVTKSGEPDTVIGAMTAPTKKGYTFKEWSPSFNADTKYGVAGSVNTYTAVWENDPSQTFKVTFQVDSAKGTANGDVEYMVVSGNTLNNAPTVTAKAGWNFTGWKLENNTYGAEGVKNYVVTKAVTFVAQFEKSGSNTPSQNTLKVTAASYAVKAGENTQLTVTYNGGDVKNASWTITGNSDPATKIVNNVLTVGSKETNGTQLKITAEANGLSDTVVVVVIADGGTVTPGTDIPKKDDQTGEITVPGKPGDKKDDITIKPGKDDNGKDNSKVDKDGNIDLPDGGTIKYPDGSEIEVPGPAKGDKDGNITLPDGGVIKKEPSKDEITVPGGTTVDKDGNITLPDNGGNGSVKKDDNTVIEIPGGSKIDKDGTITFPDDKGGTVTKPDGSKVEVPGGSKIDPDGTIYFMYRATHKYKNGGVIEVEKKLVKEGETYTFSSRSVSGYTADQPSVAVKGGDKNYVITFTYTRNSGGTVIVPPSNPSNPSKPSNPDKPSNPSDTNRPASPSVTGVSKQLESENHIAYMGGYGNGMFGPNDQMTRAQVAQMFYNLLKDKNIAIIVNFSDVQGSDWYATAVNTLASLGIIRGVGDGVFDPNRSITRAEFATIALRFADKTADGTNPFTDVASNDWYYSAVLNAVGFGWITGYSDGSFRPNASITRAEVATIVNRMLDRNADHDFVNGNATASFVDVPSNHWAYYNIMEATTPHTHTVDRNGNESWGKLQ